MQTLKRTAAIRREFTTADRIPYSAHVSPTVVRTMLGDYLQVFRLGGASFESNDDEELNNWHERLNVLWRNLGSANVALWTQVIRRRAGVSSIVVQSEMQRPSGRPFADALDAKYRSRLATETLMSNEIYLAVVYRPTSGAVTGLLSKILARAQREESRGILADALDACEKLAQTLHASLDRYEPDLLGVYRSGSLWCSSLLEYLGLLINGEWQRCALPSGPLHHAFATTRLLFGTEAIEYRTPTATRVGAMLGIKEYPTPSIVENCGNTLILRCSASEGGGTARFASQLIGEREVTHTTVSKSRRATELFGSVTHSEHRSVEPAVLPSQVEQLPDLSGYLKYASDPRWQQVRLDAARVWQQHRAQSPAVPTRDHGRAADE
jgi:type IV secretory pathway VirB4 component